MPGQKQQQLSEDGHIHLFDCTCLWLWLRDHMAKTFPGDVISKHDTLWEEGCPGWQFFWGAGTIMFDDND